MSILALKNQIDEPRLKKSTFDLGHVHATTGYFGELRPVGIFEVLPNDNWKMKINHIIRCLPLSGPLTTRVDVYLHAFFVSNQNLDETWTEFITGRSAIVPSENIRNVTFEDDTIGAAYGIPRKTIGNLGDVFVSKFPLYGYVKIYNDFYRNKIVTDEVDPSLVAYSDKLYKRNWRKDYFTSAMPTPQFGSASQVDIDVSYKFAELSNETTNPPTASSNLQSTAQISGKTYMKTVADLEKMYVKNIQNDQVNVDVNDIRWAFALQNWLQLMLSAGDDYRDHLLYVFGVKSSDARHRKAEYIGGYTKPLIINDVTQLSETTGSHPLGEQAGQGVTYGQSEYLNFHAEEHGFIHVIMSVIPKSSHYGGLPKFFRKFTVTDYAFPQFANLPEQEILKEEIYLSSGPSDQEVFGYLERYGEYKHYNDRISGQMDNEYKHLHFTRIAATTADAVLNTQFLQASVREDAFAVAGDIHYFGQIGFDIECSRVLPFNVDGVVIL